jgi:uncharacterized protein YkwD
MTSRTIASVLIILFAMHIFGASGSAFGGILTPQEQALANLLLNDAGQKRNRGAMQADPTLTAVARNKARDMAVRGYFDHITPNGTGPNYNVRAAGYPLPLWWGNSRTDNNVESLSAGYQSASSAWNALMASPGHRSHLLAADSFYKDQTSYGIGYYYDQNSPYWHYFVIITAPPRAKATLTISTPQNGAKVGEEQIGVAGTVGGSDVVSALDIRLENASGNGPWTRIGLPGGSGIGGWSTTLTGLRPGTNTIRLRSYAPGGNLVAEAARSVRWVVLKPLTVNISGGGKVTSGFLGTTSREVGVAYTITASPLDESSIFSHWTGLPPGANSGAAKQTFVMVEGLNLSANFAPNPFWTRRGKYVGVSTGQQAFNTGQLKLSVGSSGSFTGRLFYGQGSYALRGTMNANGFASMQIKRPGGTEIGLSFTLDVIGDSARITGAVNEYGMITPFTSDLQTAASEQFAAGRFTIRITPDNAVPTTPRGNGYATAMISDDGSVRVIGTLADGRSFSSNSIISKAGQIPIYARLFGGAGAVTGTAALVNTQQSDIDGSIRYFKPERLSDKYYPSAFTALSWISGSRYVKPAKGEPFINFQTTENRGRLLLSQGNIQNQIAQPLEVAPDNTVALQTPTYSGLKVSVNPNTGRFSGSFVHPTAGVRKFSGIVTQKQRSGWGFFLGVDQSGATVLQPQP